MSEHSRELQASLMDLPRLERLFEKQAERGYMITGISGFWGSGNAVYEDVISEPCHFCVRPFEKQDLPQVKAAFESCGWTLGFTHGSLAVFCSKAPRRPAVPDCIQEKQRELLLKKVCREERKLLLALQIYMMFVELWMFYIIFNRLSSAGGPTGSNTDKGLLLVTTAVFATAYLISTFSVCLGQWLRHFRTAGCLKAGKSSPERVPSWNTSVRMSLGIGGLTLALIYSGWLLGDLTCSLLAAGCLLTCAANMAVCSLWHKNTGLHRWRFIPWLLIPVAVLLLFLCLSRLQ